MTAKICTRFNKRCGAASGPGWHDGNMQDGLMRALLTIRPTLRQRWETLLRAERATSPLANPDALVYLMDWTLDRLFEDLRAAPSRRRPSARTSTAPAPEAPPCPCGLNPLLAYFQTAEKALDDTFRHDLPDTHLFTLLEREAAWAELRLVLQGVARREIESFCAVCMHGHRETLVRPAPTSASR